MSSRQLFLTVLDHYNQIDDTRRQLFRDWSQFARNWSEEELAASMNGGANNDFDAGCSVGPLRSAPGGGRPVATERSLRRQIYEGLLNRDDFGRLSRTNKDKGVTTILVSGSASSSGQVCCTNDLRGASSRVTRPRLDGGRKISQASR